MKKKKNVLKKVLKNIDVSPPSTLEQTKQAISEATELESILRKFPMEMNSEIDLSEEDEEDPLLGKRVQPAETFVVSDPAKYERSNPSQINESNLNTMYRQPNINPGGSQGVSVPYVGNLQDRSALDITRKLEPSSSPSGFDADVEKLAKEVTQTVDKEYLSPKTFAQQKSPDQIRKEQQPNVQPFRMPTQPDLAPGDKLFAQKTFELRDDKEPRAKKVSRT